MEKEIILENLDESIVNEVLSSINILDQEVKVEVMMLQQNMLHKFVQSWIMQISIIKQLN